ncbi:protein-L-isoaspartate O-methyltransferase domain-containing protein 1-like [Artemia franciscana]|uniref:Protein-L-isoaspartate O-methyltransferase domain-containing protein 1 n=1 Tax=Artemia franciscana TaxID=6661 RepID=A0AA88I4A3_ARTSF|nr:hypothetical protein QYM36_002912 [Artemia franciscana]KAK2722528.1 hypothetical protein QYM36_002912 [Artemia franciscana]
MGGAVSSGVDNDSLVDNLISVEYIKTPEVERVFRAVDRGFYYTESGKSQAYRDMAWKDGNLHLSAPCIYSKVMESLELKPGLSFLNMGSGTGYLSTMVGLMTGSFGINHGIEIHEDVADYAQKKLDDFKTTQAIDEFDFSEPVFTVGNCLSIPHGARRYDRVYCGAACPVNWKQHVQSLVGINGILIMPMEDQLLKFTRKSESSWDCKSLLPVSFSSLVLPDQLPIELTLPPCSAPELQDLLRALIRRDLRRCIEEENPDLWKCMRRTPPSKDKATNNGNYTSFNIVPFPLADSDDDSDLDSDYEPGYIQRHIMSRESFLRIAREFAADLPDNGPRDNINHENDDDYDPLEDDHDTSMEDDDISEEDGDIAEEEEGFENLPVASDSGDNVSVPNGNNGRSKFDSGVGDLSDESSSVGNGTKSGHQALPTEKKEEEEAPMKPVGFCSELSEEKYSKMMKSKIAELPLPPGLKSYLNYYRSFE